MRLFLVLMLVSFVAIGQQNDQQLAYQYYINGEYNKAISIYEKLSKEGFTVGYYTPYFSSLLGDGKYKEAEKLAKKISRIYPKSLSYQVDVGIVQEKAGNIWQSERTLKNIFQKLNGKKSQAINLANAFSRHAMYEDALRIYSISEGINPKVDFGIQKAQLYEYLGKTDLMLKEYFNVLERNPNQELMVTSKVQRFLANDGIRSDKNYQVVKRALLPYVRSEVDRVDFSELLIWLFMQNGQYNMALKQAKALDKRTYAEGEKVYDIAELFLDNKYYDLAVDAYDYIIAKGSKNFLFVDANINKLYALTKSLSDQKKDVSILDDTYKQVIRDLGKNKNTVLLLLNYAHFQGFYLYDLSSAESILNEAMSIPQISKGDLAECKLEYADIMLIKGDIWESLLYYSQVEKTFKEHPIGHEAKLRRAKIAYYQGDFQWAQAQLGALKASTSKLIANDAMELSLLITDNYNLDTTETAMKIFSNADLLTYQQKYTEAITQYDSILTFFENHPLSDEIYMRKAEIYTKNNNIEMALQMCKSISDDWEYDILADDALYKQATIYDNILKDSVNAMIFYERILLEYNGSIFTAEARRRFRALRGDDLNFE